MNKKLLRNKYFLVFMAGLIWVTFFDSNNLLYQYRLSNEIKKSEAEKAFYISEIERIKINQASLDSNIYSVEKFGREEYLMKKENETLYLLKERD